MAGNYFAPVIDFFLLSALSDLQGSSSYIHLSGRRYRLCLCRGFAGNTNHPPSAGTDGQEGAPEKTEYGIRSVFQRSGIRAPEDDLQVGFTDRYPSG